MKPKYPYSPELKAPMNFGTFDLEKIVLSGKMNRVAKFISGQTRRFKSKNVTIMKQTYPSKDGKELSYYEFTPKKVEERYPAMIYYHGGGFMFPIQKAMMVNSSLFAQNVDVKVFLPEYRTSMDSSCDTILEDCYAMLAYVFEHAEELQVDTKRVFIYGDSAGGCLAASVALLNRDRNAYPICGQMLVYPVCDNESDQYDSVTEYRDAAWSKSSNEQMWRLYLRNGSEMMDYIVPMRNDLHGLPPAYIEPQQYDTLRDEAIAYANKLQNAGVSVEVNLISGSFHGFDAQIKSPLVQRVLEHRYHVMRHLIA